MFALAPVTIHISSGTFESTETGGDGLLHYEASYTVSGSQITFTSICDSHTPATHMPMYTYGYTATSTQLVLFRRDSTSVNKTFTRQ